MTDTNSGAVIDACWLNTVTIEEAGASQPVASCRPLRYFTTCLTRSFWKLCCHMRMV